MKPEVPIIRNIKKNYKKGIERLFLDQFITMLQKLKVEKEKYREFIRYNYYFILGCRNHCNILIEDFFEFLQNL